MAKKKFKKFSVKDVENAADDRGLFAHREFIKLKKEGLRLLDYYLKNFDGDNEFDFNRWVHSGKNKVLTPPNEFEANKIADEKERKKAVSAARKFKSQKVLADVVFIGFISDSKTKEKI